MKNRSNELNKQSSSGNRCANGIGQQIACHLALHGVKVIVSDIDDVNGNLLMDKQPPIDFFKTDMALESEINALYAFIWAKYERLDILINNVGLSRFKPFLEMTTNDWDTVLNVNLRAAFICSREMAKRHPSPNYGRIINIASTRHLMSEPNSEAYAASKGGLVSLTHALAASLSNSGITVNCISPGWIHNGKPEELTVADNQQHFSGRVGKPQDVANLCWFLCQPENDFINGQNHYIDGGMTKKMIYL